MVLKCSIPSNKCFVLLADGLEVPPGTEVCFVFKRHGKMSFSPSSEVWEDGNVYWEAKCSQVR